MTTCIRCHRPLKHPTETGMGAVCARKAKVQPVPAYERDLLDYELDRAEASARYAVGVHIEAAAAEAYIAVRDGFAAARYELLGWGKPR